jgi:hypothetical protein
VKRYKTEQLRVSGPIRGFLIHTPSGKKMRDIYPNTIVKELNRMAKRIKRLEEAGDAMTNCIACGCNDGGCTTCRGYEDKWVKAKEAKL